MKTRFNQKTAKEIALTSFGYVIDCIMGNGDMGYDLGTLTSEFEQNFTEDLEERSLIVTDHRISVINQEYDKLCSKMQNRIWRTYYSKEEYKKYNPVTLKR